MARTRSAQEKYEVFTKYFESGFDLKNLNSVWFPRAKIHELELDIRTHLQEFLVDLQSELFRVRKIEELVFYELSTPKLMKKLIHFDEVLDKGVIKHFLSLYRTFCKNIGVKIPGYMQIIIPVSLEMRFKIYQTFKNYAERKNLFQNTFNEALEAGQFIEDMGQIYGDDQLDLIYQSYAKQKGNLSLVAHQLKNNGLSYPQFEPSFLRKSLQNLKIIGLFKAYLISSEWMGNECLPWCQFKVIYKGIYVNWDQNSLQKLIRIAIYQNSSAKEMKELILKMALSYIEIHDQHENPKFNLNTIKEQIKRKVEQKHQSQ